MSGRRQGGFTIVEIVMMLAVFVLLSAVTVPPVLSAMQTYRRNLGAREVLAEVRLAQSLSVSRGEVYGFQWDADPGFGPSRFRIVRDATGACDLPPETAPVDGIDVVKGWEDLQDDYPGISIRSIEDHSGKMIDEVIFDPLGASINPCENVVFPVRIVVADGAGRTETIVVSKSGMAKMP